MEQYLHLIGTTLSHFKITAKLGEGGMGEVYRATDTQLGRDVAIKVLPAEMANDRERLERFSREARSLASLDHPNIVPVHSVDEAGGRHLLVMGLIEGSTLEGLIPERGMPLEQLLDTAIPIADALVATSEAKEARCPQFAEGRGVRLEIRNKRDVESTKKLAAIKMGS